MSPELEIPAPATLPAPATPSFPEPSDSVDAEALAIGPKEDQQQSFKQWVAVRVEVDLNRASHRRGKVVSLLPYMGAYFFFKT